MKCFYHPETDGVGICRQCGKFCCKECITDLSGQMICKGCHQLIEQARMAEARTAQQCALAQADDMRRAAAKRIKRSWIVAVVCGVFIFLLCLGAPSEGNGAPPLPSYVMGPLGAYVWWGIFWGFVWVWPHWRNFVAKFKRAISGWIIIARPFTWFMLFFFYLVVYWTVPLMGAVYYGVFGGAFYQYKKHRRLAAEKPLAAAAHV
jgi:hypothetical protein